jgi:hypothetical protein
MRFTVAALARPGMQRHLMLFARLVAGREIRDARFPERDIRKGGRARRLVIDFRTAEQAGERGIGAQRRMHGAAQRDGSGCGHVFLPYPSPAREGGRERQRTAGWGR